MVGEDAHKVRLFQSPIWCLSGGISISISVGISISISIGIGIGIAS